MGLDINTPKGQITLMQEREALNIVREKTGFLISETKKLRHAVFDGNLIHPENYDNCGLFETKCRNINLYTLTNTYKDWILTLEKVRKCAYLAKSSQVPFYGVLYLTSDKKCLLWKLTDHNGKFLIKHRIERTWTKKTVNGGLIKRKNIYFDFEDGIEKGLIKILN
jgi:hypothetical protein